jgi:exonuclease III
MAHSDPTMRILTWNLRHGGGARVPAQLVAIAGHAPEIVVLTEYRTGPAGERLTRGLDALGFVHQAVTPTLPPRRNAVLIGDFNTGKHRVDELGATFVLSECLDALERRGWVDAWRLRNGDTRASSWFSSAGNGFRIDHAFVTRVLVTGLVDARYSDAERAAGLSDHAALVVDLEIVG